MSLPPSPAVLLRRPSSLPGSRPGELQDAAQVDLEAILERAALGVRRVEPGSVAEDGVYAAEVLVFVGLVLGIN